MRPLLNLYMQDGSIFEDEKVEIVMAEQGIIQYNIPPNVIKHVGKVNAKLFLVNENESVHAVNFSFNIKDSGIEEPVRKELSFSLVDEAIRRIIKDNTLEILDDDFKDRVNEDLKGYVTSNPSMFKGTKGDRGEQGIVGPQGEKGPQGEQGPKGENAKPITVKSYDYDDLGNTTVNMSDNTSFKVSKGNKGDAFTYNDFSSTQLNDLTKPIEDKVDNKLKKINGLSDVPKTIYVDKKNVNSGDGTAKNPFKTIQQAFDSIPKIIDKRYTVLISPGEYDEEAYLTGVIGGTIFIQSASLPSSIYDIDVRVKSLNFYDVVGYVHIENIGNYGGTLSRKAFILFSRCIYGSVSRCLIDRETVGVPSIYWDGSYGSNGTSYFNNQEICIQSQNGSTVRIDSNNEAGNNNKESLYSLNGFIFKSGTNEWVNKAITPEVIENGGQINGLAEGWKLLSYLNDWTTNSGVALKYKKVNDNLCMLYGWVNKQPLDTTVIANIPQGYRPINTQRHPVTVTGTAGVQSSLPILEVRNNGDIRLVTTGDVPPNNGIAINILLPII